MIKIEDYQEELVEQQFNDQKETLEKEVKKWILEQLEEYDKFYYLVEEMEVHNVDDLTVTITDIDYKIVEVKGDTVFIEVNYDFNIKGDVEHDDVDSSQYDSEDKSSFYREQKVTSIDHDVSKTSVFKIDIRSDDDFDEEFELELHNNGEPIVFG